MDLQERYSKALKQIGGAAALLNLPKEVQDNLKSITDLEKKVKILETIAAFTKAERKRTCKYCHMKSNGDIPSDRKPLFKIKVGTIWGHEIILDGVIYHNILEVGTEIGCEDGSKDIEIHYCPMCGRKL